MDTNRPIRRREFVKNNAVGVDALSAAPAYLSALGTNEKILAGVIMSGMHAAMVVWQNAFEANENRRGQAFYRVMNEVPTVLLIVIILMVVVKPF